ncbi:MAG: protein translocase subunit SecF, partial [Pseudonocardiaceae bacterium]
NQTLMRSINTSLIAVLPVLSLLVVGAGLLGVGTLKDLALVQMIGITSGAMSSIFLATPLMVDLTMARPAYRQQAERVAARREKLARPAGPTNVAGDALGGVTGAPAVTAKLGKTVPGRRREHPAGKSGRPSGKTGRPSGR